MFAMAISQSDATAAKTSVSPLCALPTRTCFSGRSSADQPASVLGILLREALLDRRRSCAAASSVTPGFSGRCR